MTRSELKNKIFQASHITGSFKLRSGVTSNEYFDKYQFESDPQILSSIAKQMIPLIPKGTDVLAGLEVGGIPIATALSLQTGLPITFVRKTAKEYGTCKFAEGHSVNNKNICIVEDVVTSGGQIIISAEDLRKENANILGAICVIDREQGGPKKLLDKGIVLSALFTMTELKNN